MPDEKKKYVVSFCWTELKEGITAINHNCCVMHARSEAEVHGTVQMRVKETFPKAENIHAVCNSYDEYDSDKWTLQNIMEG